MASGSGVRSYTGTLASSVDVVLLTAACDVVTITNVTGGAPIWFTVSEPGGPCPAPASVGANAQSVSSVAGQSVDIRHPGMFGTIAQLQSTGTPTYTVSIQNKV